MYKHIQTVFGDERGSTLAQRKNRKASVSSPGVRGMQNLADGPEFIQGSVGILPVIMLTAVVYIKQS